jgi:hypothetical protein
MKIDDRTLIILKSFSTINKSILFKKGNVLCTLSPAKSVMGIAKVNEEFPIDFGVYDLSRLLGVLSIFDSPKLDFEVDEDGKASYLSIKDDKNHSVKFIASPSKTFDHPYNDEGKLKQPPFSEFEIEFELSNKNLSVLMKASAMMQLPEIVVIGNGKEIKIVAMAVANPTGDEYAIKLNLKTKHKFKMVFPVNNMLLISEDYKVSISSKGMGKFVGSDIQYWVMCDSKESKFEV